MDFDLSAEHELIRDTVRQFAVERVAPVAEEIFFRGFFFAGLRRSLPFWAAALISGAVFGVIHLSTGDFGVAGQLAIFGIVLAWLYEEHDSLVPAIALHVLNNAIAFTFLVSA